MNPLLVEFLGSVVRWVATAFFAILAGREIITADQQTRFLDALSSPEAILWGVGLLAPLVWSFFQKYRSRLKLLTSLATTEPKSEAQVESMVKSGQTPSHATVQKDVQPTIAPPTA